MSFLLKHYNTNLESILLSFSYYISLHNCTDSLSFTVHPTVPSPPRQPSVIRVFEDGIELNWLPPTEPNGEVLHYVIYYTPEGGTEQSNDTGSNLTHYNLTGLERNRVYTNIAVQAVNSAGKSDRSAVIAWYYHHPSSEYWFACAQGYSNAERLTCMLKTYFHCQYWEEKGQ